MGKYTLKSCGVNTARFLKYVWPFYNIMHERVKKRAFAFYNSQNNFFSEHFKVVVSVFNRTSKFENLKSTDATTERCSGENMFCNFLKTKVTYLTSTKNS